MIDKVNNSNRRGEMIYKAVGLSGLGNFLIDRVTYYEKQRIIAYLRSFDYISKSNCDLRKDTLVLNEYLYQIYNNKSYQPGDFGFLKTTTLKWLGDNGYEINFVDES